MENLNDKFKDRQFNYDQYEGNDYNQYDDSQDEYNNGGYEYEGGEQPKKSNKSIRGLQIMIIILAVILAGLSYIYYAQVKEMKAEYNDQREAMTAELQGMVESYDGLQVEYDTLSQSMVVERERVDSLMQTIQKERRLNRAKMKEYEVQITGMRRIITESYETIDSLNKVNQGLIADNQEVRTRLASATLRADRSEEAAAELDIRVRQGAIIKVRGINMVPLSANDREVTRTNNASRLRVDFQLTANELANPGRRSIYVRIISPDGYVLPNNSNATLVIQMQRSITRVAFELFGNT